MHPRECDTHVTARPHHRHTNWNNSINWPLQKILQHTIMFFVCHPKILHKHCFQFLLGVKMAPRETENNACAKFWGWKTKSIMVCYATQGFTWQEIVWPPGHLKRKNNKVESFSTLLLMFTLTWISEKELERVKQRTRISSGQKNKNFNSYIKIKSN